MQRKSIWTTKDKVRIPVTQMSNQHLLNTHKCLCRSLNQLLSGMADRRLSEVPDLLRDRVFGVTSWLDIFEQSALDRCLGLLHRRPNHPAILECIPVWISNTGKLISVVNLEDADLLQIYQNVSNNLVDLTDLYNFAFGPLAPGEDTMASDDLNRCLDDAIEEEFFFTRWNSILAGEVNRRGLEARSIKTPMPEAKVVSEELGPGGRGKIMQIEWHEINQQEL